MTKIEMNIAAAKFLGYDYIVHDKLISISIRLPGDRTRLFNIFNTPADVTAAIKALGEDKSGFNPLIGAVPFALMVGFLKQKPVAP